MVMVVECESCHSRFRVKKSLLDGAFAIRFRCRTCDGFIVVRNPEMRRIAPALSTTLPTPTAALEVPAAPSMRPEPEIPANADKPAPPETLRGTEPLADGNPPAPPAAAAPPDTRMEDLVPYMSEGEGRADQDNSGGAVGVKRRSTDPARGSNRKLAWSIAWFTSLVGLGLLLVACVAYFFWISWHP